MVSVAQLVEPRIVIPVVVGSSPIVHPIYDMKKSILFGADVQHSLSPAIYADFAAHYSLAFDYEVCSIEAASLSKHIQRIRDAGYIGCNLTNPLKQQLATQVVWGDACVERFQSANVLHFQGGKLPMAWNTDGIGFIEDIKQYIDCVGCRVLLLGSGGIVPPLAYYLHMEGVDLTIAARDVTRLRSNMMGVLEGPVRLIDFCAVESEYQLVINATSVGWEILQPQFAHSPLAAATVYYDCRYGVQVKRSLQLVKAQGVPYGYCGLGMLVRQAAHAFSIWTGYMPDKILMKEVEQRCHRR